MLYISKLLSALNNSNSIIFSPYLCRSVQRRTSSAFDRGSFNFLALISMNKLKLVSNIVSVGLLALCLSFASWFLLSYPVTVPVNNYFYSVNGVAYPSSSGSWQNIIPSVINNTENVFNVSLDVQQPLAIQKDRDEGLQQNSEAGDKQRADDGKIDQPLSESTNKNTTNLAKKENTTTDSSSQSSIKGQMISSVFNSHIERVDDGKIDQPLSESTNKNTTILTKKESTTTDSSSQSSAKECDLFHGKWFYDKSGALYTNKSCPIIIDKQNCQANERPDRGFESWRWKPSQCVLPKFDANKFLELMSGKTLAFFGDSVSYNQMTSLVCILWQVEVPERRGFGEINRWYFKSKSVSIVRIWSAWLVNQTVSAFKDIPEGIPKVFLDIPHETLMEHAPKFDVLVVSSGHWFTVKSVYVRKNKVVGGQLWAPPNGRKLHVNNVEAYRIALDTSITALATHPNYTGLTILRSYSPDHYGGGAWNTGGSCTGKVEPARPDQLMKNDFTDVMYEKQVTGFNRAVKKRTNGSKMRLMDITKAFSYRHDGHPGPYWTGDPIKRTTPGPDGRLHPQDCVHWCTPGPIDTWNEILLEMIRREFEK